jgi:hypothetical protein
MKKSSILGLVMVLLIASGPILYFIPNIVSLFQSITSNQTDITVQTGTISQYERNGITYKFLWKYYFDGWTYGDDTHFCFAASDAGQILTFPLQLNENCTAYGLTFTVTGINHDSIIISIKQ